jgi:hypothetical protein
VKRGGAVTSERLEAIDSAAHRITYGLLPPYRLAPKNVRATIAMTPLGQNTTELQWWSEASELDAPQQEIATYIGSFYRASVGNLRRRLGS